MIGGALVATRGPATELGGAELEAAMWLGRIGVAAHGSHQAGANTRLTTLGGSLRLLVYRQLTPSLLDPREDVELGFEAHGIVERAWWDEEHARDPMSYGGGLVVRLRGGTDFSNILAESRLFIRVMWTRDAPMDTIARTSTEPETERNTSIVVGLGAVFGGGQPAYAKQFKPRPIDVSILPIN